MPRKAKKQSNGEAKVHQAEAKTETPPVGDNLPDRETFHYFVGLIDAEDAKVDAARQARKDVRRRATDAGLSLEVIDLLRKKRDKEYDTAGGWIQSLMQAFKWMGLPVAVQPNLFPEDAKIQSLNERAEEEGRIDGLEGKTAEGDRYDPTTETGQARLRGWNEGQRIIRERFIDKQQTSV